MTLNALLHIKNGRGGGKEEHWIPLADVMTGLMMMFLLIAIAFMIKVEAEEAQMRSIASKYFEIRQSLYIDLEKEFQHDLPRWGATLDKDLTIRFKEPDVLFDTGQDTLKPRFKEILDNFFPRYVMILNQEKYRSSIEEIRIEGHTSVLWRYSTSPDEAYFLNMALSQSRTRSTLQYVLTLTSVIDDREWLKAHLTANGLSSSRPVLRPGGAEDQEASQRVEFRVRTDAETQISRLLRPSSK